MHLRLKSPVSKLYFAAAGTLLLAGYLTLITRSFVASGAFNATELQTLQRAAQLEPWNAEHHYRLGMVFFYLLNDLPNALNQFNRAVELNPHSASYWLELAGVHQVRGDKEQQARALESALRAEPTDPEVSWQAGNLFLVKGDTDRALHLFRQVIAKDEKKAPAAMELSWRAAKDPTKMLSLVVEPTSTGRLQFLKFSCDHKESESAQQAWDSLLSLKQPFQSKDTFFYFDFLIARHDLAQAQKMWSTLETLDSALSQQHVANNLLENQSFEMPILNAGFSWRFESRGPALAFDTAHLHEGTRSIEVTFPGNDGVSTIGLRQLVPVEPNTHYYLRGFMQAEDLDGSNGARFLISNAYSSEPIAQTDEILGTTPWREMHADFTTDNQTQLIELIVGRNPSAGRLLGKLWIDDVHLQRVQ